MLCQRTVVGVMGYGPLVKLVRTNALLHVSIADQFLALCSALAGILLSLGFRQPRLQQRHRFGAVLVLRAFFLTFDDHATRHVRDADRAFRIVDVLATGATGTEQEERRVRKEGFRTCRLRWLAYQ